MAESDAITEGPRPVLGRPRDATRDATVLAAVRELLAEEGYHALSVHKVTLRCGVHAKTISRRWSTKAEMVAAAVLWSDRAPFADSYPTLPTGDLAADIRELVNRNMAYISQPATRAALAGVQSELDSDEGVFAHFERREVEWRSVIRSVLQGAIESGDAPASVLGKERVLARIIAGTTFDIVFAPLRTPEDASAIVDDLVRFLLAALTAAD